MSLYVEIGLQSDQIIDEQSLLNQVLADLKSSGVIVDQELVDHEFIVMNPAYVHITKDSEERYTNWCREYNHLGVYSVGRYGSWTYCSIEDNIIQARETVETFSKVSV